MVTCEFKQRKFAQVYLRMDLGTLNHVNLFGDQQKPFFRLFFFLFLSFFRDHLVPGKILTSEFYLKTILA